MKPFINILAVGLIVFLSACSSSSSNSEKFTCSPIEGDADAFIAVSGGIDSGVIERYDLSTCALVDSFPAATSGDIRVATDSRNVYQIGRFGLDTLTKFDPEDSTTALFQYSVNGDVTSGNPYSLAFLNDTKAYMMRYGSNKVWIIDPTVGANEEPTFMAGELDLSAYDTGGTAKISQSVLVGDKLFILMERLDAAFQPTAFGYVAVFDTNTDTEIDTGKGENGLLGIKLSTLNPGNIQYVEATKEIYVTGRGNQYGAVLADPNPYQGGIETIDPATYEIEMLLDDGDEADNNGFFINSFIVSPTAGYVVTNNGTFGEDTLRAFNPTTGVLDTAPIAGLEDTGISNLNAGPNGNLWVGVPGATPGDGSGYFVIDSTTNATLGGFATTFSPLNVVFIDLPETP